jgi:hypothetical protein
MTINKLQVKTIKTDSGLQDISPFWKGAQWHPNADYDFFRMIVNVRKNVCSPYIITVFRDENPVAIWAGRLEKCQYPIRVGYATICRIPIKQIVFIEGGIMGEQTKEICYHLFDNIKNCLSENDCQLAIIGQVNNQSDIYNESLTILRTPDKTSNKRWQMKFPLTWDLFLQSRSKKHRYWLNRIHRVLDREFPGQWEIQSYYLIDHVDKFINLAETVAKKTYQRGLEVGFRANIETSKRLHLDAENGRLRGYVLLIKGQARAFWYCQVYRQVLYSASTGYDPEYRKYELGTILLMKIFKDHCGTEIAAIDFGQGDADYKRRFGSQFAEESSFFVFSTSFLGTYIRFLNKLAFFINRVAMSILYRFNAVQRIKSFWRGRLLK